MIENFLIALRLIVKLTISAIILRNYNNSFIIFKVAGSKVILEN